MEPRTGIEDFHLQLAVFHGENDSNAEALIKAISVFDSVDARLGDGSLQVFNSVIGKAHQPGDSRRGLHGYLLKSKLGRKPQFDCGYYFLRHTHLLKPSFHFSFNMPSLSNELDAISSVRAVTLPERYGHPGVRLPRRRILPRTRRY